MSQDQATIPHWYQPDSDVLQIERGDGARVYDAGGEDYLDFISQLYCCNAGFANEAITDAMAEQMAKMPYISPKYHTSKRLELASKLIEVSPQALSDVYFAISGSEANEAAVQFAREYTDAPKVLTRWRSYHGWTYGAGSLTGDPSTRAVVETHASTSGAVKFLPPMTYRSPFDGDTPEEIADQAADHLEFVIRNEDPDSIAAILMEPVAGAAGGWPAPPGYFERVRELCDQYDILLISDEVITGFGRTGEWFGIQTEGVQPDLLTFAKAVTSAYVPLAGVMMNDDVSEFLRSEGIGVGQTFGGHATACAGGVAAMEQYENGLIDNVNALAPVLEEGLQNIADRHDAVGDVRGRGFLWGVEFTDPATGEPFFDPYAKEEGHNPVADVVTEARERGVIVGKGRPLIHLNLAPPFVVDEADIEEALDAFDAAIGAVFG